MLYEGEKQEYGMQGACNKVVAAGYEAHLMGSMQAFAARHTRIFLFKSTCLCKPFMLLPNMCTTRANKSLG